ncbi:hypothetical protein PIROE2DRAFT_57255 [Piromyces sp. E2]|nr:hypothetical protein PIROE2DRAFT_57255 [Piromyces sp. E2]|eukprot:OUM69705.1 hypothetical protein PIROE2DRAFT_57255 [Piromyces sp. E2]
MTIGIENITVIVKSVVNTSIELPFNERYALGMKNISWEIMLPLIINVLIISCGAFSPYGYIGLYDLYTIQSEKNHKLIEQIGKNNVRYNRDNGIKPYHPLLDIKRDDLSDVDSSDENNDNKRKIVLSLLIFGNNINQDEEKENDIYYSKNYNKTYNSLSIYKDSIDFSPDVVTSISHLLPKYWSVLKNNYNEKIIVESSALSEMNINHFVVMNDLLHITVEDKFEQLYDPTVNIFGINIIKFHPFVIALLTSFELLMIILLYMFLNSCIYILYSKLLEYSKRITSTFIHMLYYFLPIFDYNNFIFKKYIIPLYQPNFITKVDKDQLERYQKNINYNCAYSSTIDIHIINNGEYETIDYIIIKNANEKAISSHYQQNLDTEDEKAIILWGGNRGSVYIWSDDPLIKKRKNQNDKENSIGIYYYRNPYLAKFRYNKENDAKDNVYFIENFSVYINKPTFKCEMDISHHICDLSLDAYNNNVLMAGKTFLYQWEYINKKINYFDIVKVGEQDEILWILNSNEQFGDVKKHRVTQYLQNQQFYDSDLCSQIINNEEPYFKAVITKNGKIITFDAFMNVIGNKKSEETEHLLRHYRHSKNNITMNEPFPNPVYTTGHDESIHLSQHENDMHFTILSSQAKAEININKNNSFYTNNNSNYWSSHYRGHKRNNSDHDYFINEKLFISRKYSKIITSNEEVGWVVTSDATGYMTVWSIKEGKVWDNVKCPSPITKIYIVKSQSKRGTWWIVSSHEDETVRFWSTNAGILSCSSVLYQPGCNTIACHNSIIAGVRRVCIRENTFMEKLSLKLFIYLVLILNFTVNIFFRHYYAGSVNSVELIYEYLIQIYYTKGRTILRRTIIRLRDFIVQFLPLPVNLSSDSSMDINGHNKSHRNSHRHRHQHHRSSSSSSFSTSPSHKNDHNIWMWQVWLYNIDTDLPRYLNFAVDKLNGLGVPKQRVVAMPRFNILFQIYDLTIEEENNTSPSSVFRSGHAKDDMINRTAPLKSEYLHIFQRNQNRLNLQDIGKLYNEIPSDVNIEEIGNSLGLDPHKEFHIQLPVRQTAKDINDKETLIRKTYHQPPVLKINHININSRLICFDFGQQLRVFSFKNIENKKKSMRKNTK